MTKGHFEGDQLMAVIIGMIITRLYIRFIERR
jgi:hypothetical protein